MTDKRLMVQCETAFTNNTEVFIFKKMSNYRKTGIPLPILQIQKKSVKLNKTSLQLKQDIFQIQTSYMSL